MVMTHCLLSLPLTRVLPGYMRSLLPGLIGETGSNFYKDVVMPACCGHTFLSCLGKNARYKIIRLCMCVRVFYNDNGGCCGGVMRAAVAACVNGKRIVRTF